jgi:hypothetical protein
MVERAGQLRRTDQRTQTDADHPAATRVDGVPDSLRDVVLDVVDNHRIGDAVGHDESPRRGTKERLAAGVGVQAGDQAGGARAVAGIGARQVVARAGVFVNEVLEIHAAFFRRSLPLEEGIQPRSGGTHGVAPNPSAGCSV